MPDASASKIARTVLRIEVGCDPNRDVVGVIAGTVLRNGLVWVVLERAWGVPLRIDPSAGKAQRR